MNRQEYAEQILALAFPRKAQAQKDDMSEPFVIYVAWTNNTGLAPNDATLGPFDTKEEAARAAANWYSDPDNYPR